MTIAILALWFGSALGYYFADPEESAIGATLFLPLAILTALAIPLIVVLIGLSLLAAKVFGKW